MTVLYGSDQARDRMVGMCCCFFDWNKISFINCTPVSGSAYSVNFLNIGTSKTFVVFTLKFEVCGSTIE